MIETLRANCGSTYETSESIILLNVEGEEKEGLEERIQEIYTTNWCNHGHDCCGCWRTTVVKMAIDHWTAVVHLRHVQNV